MSAQDQDLKNAEYGIAIDMGASHLRFVLATADGAIRAESREHVKAEAGPAGVIAQLRDGIATLIKRSSAEHGKLRGIAIGVPGGVDPQTGKVIDANNVPGWREVDMGRAPKMRSRYQYSLITTPIWRRSASTGEASHKASITSSLLPWGQGLGRACLSMAGSAADAVASRGNCSA